MRIQCALTEVVRQIEFNVHQIPTTVKRPLVGSISLYHVSAHLPTCLGQQSSCQKMNISGRLVPGPLDIGPLRGNKG